MANNPFELPQSRPASMTESGQRAYLYPADYSGRFRNIRSAVYGILLVVFLGLPWVQINGNPAILLDLPHRKFSILGLTFWAHEAPILVLVFLSFVFLIGVVTALFGRIWCGWACPQSVFIDRVFRLIERWVEGPSTVRRKLNQSGISLEWVWKKGVKWGLFIAAALVITHSFLMYFVGHKALWGMIHSDPRQHWAAFLLMAISTVIILFDFGWFREQFCIVACPYGRFQSVIMDRDSWVVGYDMRRGEPRMKDRQDVSATGDCINCYRCVQVCPTGVDIRRGTQMECIMCTACIDACDSVMTKLGKPKGLVRYTSESALSGQPVRWFRPRVWVYAGVLIALLGALTWVVSHREMVPTYVQRPVIAYSMLPNQMVLNERNITIRNQYFDSIQVQLALIQKPESRDIRVVLPMNRVTIKPGQSISVPVFVMFQSDRFKSGVGHVYLNKQVQHRGKITQSTLEIPLVGPLL